MTIDDVEQEMLEDLNSIDFDYYKRTFNKNEWQTIKWIRIDSWHGCGYTDSESKKHIGYSYTPNGCELKCGDEIKKININDLKKLFEGQNKPKQLSLF